MEGFGGPGDGEEEAGGRCYVAGRGCATGIPRAGRWGAGDEAKIWHLCQSLTLFLTA